MTSYDGSSSFGQPVSETKKPKLFTYADTIDYRDGAEDTLYEIVNRPDFDEYTSWRTCKDWALYYHLCVLRRNIVNWICWGKRPIRILELGAGCGAITSYLTTIPCATVTAVEGSQQRARIIESRCRCAANLEIHACPIDKFHAAEKFDLVTLIGVLEYAGKYGDKCDDPFTELMKRVHGMLSDDGVALIAIENRLGQKYLAGCPEEHYGIAYEGVNGYPHYNGIRTFSAPELRKVIASANFREQYWFYPYPDYKLPSVIFSHEGLSDHVFDWLSLIDIPPEPNGCAPQLFGERSFFEGIIGSGDPGLFMNSFLVVAAQSDSNWFLRSNCHVLAVKSNVKARAREFQTFTRFVRVEQRIEVQRSKVHDIPAAKHEAIEHVVDPPRQTYYLRHFNLQELLLESLYKGDYEHARIFIKRWMAILERLAHSPSESSRDGFEKFCQSHFGRTLYQREADAGWLDGIFLDLLPANVLVSKEDSQEKIIDLEWRMSFQIPVQLVFDRGLIVLSQRLKPQADITKQQVHHPTFFPVDFYHLVRNEPLFMHSDITFCSLFETWLQGGVVSGNFARKVGIAAATIEQFCEVVTSCIERGDVSQAIAIYDYYRHRFKDVEGIERFDSLIEKIRGRNAVQPPSAGNI